MRYHGFLRKMTTSLPALRHPGLTAADMQVQAEAVPEDYVAAETGLLAAYDLILGDDHCRLSDWIGHKISISYSGLIHCIHCNNRTSKSFAQGYCYRCFMRLAECDMCIIKPEKCHYEQGTCRDNDWAHAHCMQPHVVYLANSSGLKVGITRRPNVPSRWIDQGAIAAMPIMEVANRYQSGMIEVTLAQHMSDKTNWRKMLKNEVTEINLKKHYELVFSELKNALDEVQAKFKQPGSRRIDNPALYRICYPVLQYPEKVRSLSLDKQPEICSRLQGIKGQYLIFEDGVMNIRKFAGYEVSIEVA